MSNIKVGNFVCANREATVENFSNEKLTGIVTKVGRTYCWVTWTDSGNTEEYDKRELVRYFTINNDPIVNILYCKGIPDAEEI